MRGLFTSKNIDIPAGGVLSGIASRAQTLRIQRGRVWVTVEGISHDYFLHAGDTFTAIPGKLTVIEAEQDAGIASSGPFAAKLLRGIAGWLTASTVRLARPAVVRTSLKRHRTCDAC